MFCIEENQGLEVDTPIANLDIWKRSTGTQCTSMHVYAPAAAFALNPFSIVSVFSKGQMVTDRYRFLANGGGYAWVETQATVITHPQTEKPQCVVCIHSVLR